MPTITPATRLTVALSAGLVLGWAGLGQAATFSVNPTQVFLSAGAGSALVSLRNESREPLRFQLTLFAWDQRPDGEMALAPTTDIVFFPQLLSLASGEERKVRVGLAASLKPSMIERTYRLFVEELPPSQSEGRSAQGVKVLTKMGLPIFVQPASAVARPALGDVVVTGGRVSFTARNDGTAHFLPDLVAVEGRGSDGRVLFTQPVNGWYILAGGTRRFEVPAPAVDCAGVASVHVLMRVGQETLVARADTPSGSCRN